MDEFQEFVSSKCSLDLDHVYDYHIPIIGLTESYRRYLRDLQDWLPQPFGQPLGLASKSDDRVSVEQVKAMLRELYPQLIVRTVRGNDYLVGIKLRSSTVDRTLNRHGSVKVGYRRIVRGKRLRSHSSSPTLPTAPIRRRVVTRPEVTTVCGVPTTANWYSWMYDTLMLVPMLFRTTPTLE